MAGQGCSWVLSLAGAGRFAGMGHACMHACTQSNTSCGGWRAQVLTVHGTPDKPEVRPCTLSDIQRKIPPNRRIMATDFSGSQVRGRDGRGAG